MGRAQEKNFASANHGEPLEVMRAVVITADAGQSGIAVQQVDPPASPSDDQMRANAPLHAAGSGVGTAAVQLAHVAGAFVFGTSRTFGMIVLTLER